MLFDLHVHTTISSCSQLDVEQLVAEAPTRGLAGVCITDHDSMDVRHYLTEGMQPNGLCVIFGMEYATDSGDFLLIGPFENLRPGQTARELLPHVRHSGGVAIAAHPFRNRRPMDEDLIREGLCSIVEGVNGRNKISENKKTAAWQEDYNVNLVGGSDAHTIDELGKVTTTFHAEIRDRNDLVLALKDSRFTPVSSAPEHSLRNIAFRNQLYALESNL